MIFRNRNRMREYWQNLMRSTHKKVSEGAAYISRIIPYSRGENWRRNDKVQHCHQHHNKKK